MATLSASKRASLPNSAFAYVDSKGERRLPMHDESHVRNALSRFNQVKFESEEAREKAFRKLLKAATEYGIAPVGFVSRQLRRAQAGAATELPAGPVTLLLSDIEGSTGLVQSLGDHYPAFLEEVRQVIRDQVGGRGGYEVDSRADEFFAAFGTAVDAVGAAIGIQTGMAARQWPGGHEVRVRIGIHSGSPALTETGYVGLPVHVMARVCTAGHGGQIVITSATRDDLGRQGPSTRRLGAFQLQGLPEPTELFQVEAPGLVTDFPPLRVGDPV
jgi:class 3 adenylate cyclase